MCIRDRDLTATKQKDTDNEVAMNNVEVGEAYVTILFDYDDDTLKRIPWKSFLQFQD